MNERLAGIIAQILILIVVLIISAAVVYLTTGSITHERLALQFIVMLLIVNQFVSVDRK